MQIAVQRPQTDGGRSRTYIDEVIAITQELRPKMTALSGGDFRDRTAFGGHSRQTPRTHRENDDIARTPGRTSEWLHLVRDGLDKPARNADFLKTVSREESYPLSLGGPEGS